MVGLPARGKSYITKKMARYLNWLQHDTKIFNVGERRRVAAGVGPSIPQPNTNARPTDSVRRQSIVTSAPSGIILQKEQLDPPQLAAKILINGEETIEDPGSFRLPDAAQDPESHADGDHDGQESSADVSHLEAKFPELTKASTPEELPNTEAMEQSADFFDPKNKKAALIREQVALETLDELLDYILLQGGSVGILDATNSTLERRKLIMRHVRQRAGQEINVLFVESVCLDETLLESNMRLKLSGPDYQGKDPVASLTDFKKRVAIYEKNYVALGEYEEKNNMSFVQMIDVGRKIVSHQIKGFLSAQAVYYLLNFNLAPRQIWITRHGQSIDNVNGKIGGDSDLSESGVNYSRGLARFIDYQRKEWDVRQQDKARNTHFPPHPGDHTPPNPHYSAESEGAESSQNFCVWTSMLKRSIQSAQFFDEEEYDIKQMRMLDEINAGIMEGMTYEEIRHKYEDDFNLRKQDKMQYRYPGPGGEGYLDVINRLRPVIVELERMTDHVLLVTHRSVARVLLAYFKGLRRDEVADLDCPLGMLYMLEPVSRQCPIWPFDMQQLIVLRRNRMVSSSRRTGTTTTPTGLTFSLTTSCDARIRVKIFLSAEHRLFVLPTS